MDSATIQQTKSPTTADSKAGKWSRWFIISAGVILLLTAFAKFDSAMGEAHILQTPDPVIGLPFRVLFIVVSGLETMVALLCFFSRRNSLQAGFVAWLATGFVVYRLGLFWVGYQKPCNCLGNLTDSLGISPEVADWIMKGILAYLLIGSYVIVLLRSERKTVGFTPREGR
jgi:hypothetical protein